MRKVDAGPDGWLRDVAPSTEFRRWYGHEERFEEFARRYRAELGHAPRSRAVGHVVELRRAGDVVLLTAIRDVAHSGARALLDHLTSSTGS